MANAEAAPLPKGRTSEGSPGAIGGRVRRLREAMGLSLRDLAGRSEVSAPMLSQVERGEASPTLAVAAKIAHGLGLSLSQLVRLDEAPPISIVRAGDGRSGEAAGHRVCVVTPDQPGDRVVVSEHELAAGAAVRRDPPLHAPGSQEVVLVREGAVRLVLEGVPHALAAGDVATFESDLEHRIDNPHPRPARFTSVVSAG